ncbi:transmembrane-type terpene cyclase [Streptomyces sp. WMMC897]|uniref:transmembrane-type terpene cyclase n=1 Tax=Streptomyces sp. WMMC897 TaxID=3014782 RepID=UPI0022B6DFE4|nr:hypothetical protein [Streptomyces sp. WMMC897]MCZ7414535.1 hypothetical protein [Streptomyces sp. WMMC897]
MDGPTLVPLPDDPPVTLDPVDPAGWIYWPLLMVQGACWIYTYVCVIQRSLADKYLAMPLFALGLNLSWELVYGFVLPIPPEQKPINIIWAGVNCFILWMAYRFGEKDFPGLSRRGFRWMLFGSILYFGVFHFTLGWELGDEHGIYGAIGINVYMSYAFIATLRRRGSSAGQSLHIALAKMIGTFAVTLMFYAMFPDRWLLTLAGFTILGIDLVYTVLLHRQITSEGQSPWAFNRPPVAGPAEARQRSGGPRAAEEDAGKEAVAHG